MNEVSPAPPTRLHRTLTLPWLIFYGVGVTVGAGIFALIGEILLLAGDAAPVSFLIAGIVAGATAVSYALLVRVYPLAGGDAVFVSRGIGPFLGRLTGLGVAAIGIISSAVIALAFAGYAGTLIPLPQPLLVTIVIAGLTALACWGVRESIAFAAIITVLEVGTLVVIIAAGMPLLGEIPPLLAMSGLDRGLAGLAPALAGALIAFFAFIGFEDIENLAEETIEPKRNAPRAILWTLVITVVLYVLLALVAVSAPGRQEISGSQAPLAILFEQTTGIDRAPVAAMAAIAMINGILVQILMGARTLYGMAHEGLLPMWFGAVLDSRKTPARATVAIAGMTLALALAFPLVRLAEATSLVVLLVFALVNLSLYALGVRSAHSSLRRWRYWGLFSAALCLSIFGWSVWAGI